MFVQVGVEWGEPKEGFLEGEKEQDASGHCSRAVEWSDLLQEGLGGGNGERTGCNGEGEAGSEAQ